jgi:hypothetical protein
MPECRHVSATTCLLLTSTAHAHIDEQTRETHRSLQSPESQRQEREIGRETQREGIRTCHRQVRHAHSSSRHCRRRHLDGRCGGHHAGEHHDCLLLLLPICRLRLRLRLHGPGHHRDRDRDQDRDLLLRLPNGLYTHMYVRFRCTYTYIICKYFHAQHKYREHITPLHVRTAPTSHTHTSCSISTTNQSCTRLPHGLAQNTPHIPLPPPPLSIGGRSPRSPAPPKRLPPPRSPPPPPQRSPPLSIGGRSPRSGDRNH